MYLILWILLAAAPTVVPSGQAAKLDRVIVDPRRRNVVLLAALFVLQALCSNYLLVFTAFAIVFGFAGSRL